MMIRYFRPLYLTIDIVAMLFEIGPIGRFFGTDCLYFKNVSLVHFLF